MRPRTAPDSVADLTFSAASAGQTLTVAYTVATSHSSAGDGNVTLSAATLAPANVTAGRLNLTSAFNNIGVTSQSSTGTGNIDGYGNSYSAEQLASQNVSAGSTVAAGTTDFTWPNVPLENYDNVAGGAPTIQAGGLGGSSLVLLGASAGNEPVPEVPVAVTYTDRTSTLGTVFFPD